jgi:hypothetical protein
LQLPAVPARLICNALQLFRFNGGSCDHPAEALSGLREPPCGDLVLFEQPVPLLAHAAILMGKREPLKSWLATTVTGIPNWQIRSELHTPDIGARTQFFQRRRELSIGAANDVGRLPEGLDFPEIAPITTALPAHR